MTCADSEFYHFLPTLEQNVRRKTGRFPIIYDIGLTEKQRNSLKSELYQRPPDLTQGDSHERRDLIQWHQGKGGFDGSNTNGH